MRIWLKRGRGGDGSFLITYPLAFLFEICVLVVCDDCCEGDEKWLICLA